MTHRSNQSAIPRTLPGHDPETAYFWGGGSSGQLLIQRCADCGHWQHPPLPRCPQCHGTGMVPQQVSGNGRVKSYTVNHQSWLTGQAQPFVFAVIELDEQDGLYVFSNIISPAENIRSGMKVNVRFEQYDDVWLPLFYPAAPGSADA